MGIPSFYRWLSERYPRCIVDAFEAKSLENKENGLQFDNLYFDMNGIIHPCFHPEDKPAPTSYEQIFDSIFSYMDKMLAIVRPRKLLYLAIDGVAPRAKMNQQRSRRFRAAKDAAEEAAKKTRWQRNASGEKVKGFDSNVITPGTEFMALLSTALRYYICSRINNAWGWQGLKVILSDSSVPGEGEHKIMSYIRLQRNLPGYDPNTRHCMYGLDADLIMLALTTHEIHFSILREVVKKPVPSKYSSLKAYWAKKGMNTPAIEEPEELKFQFLHVWVLREYLHYALEIPDQIGGGDSERLIDDFVFMCLFVGNDFLPHMPLLEISKGAIDMLMIIYKKEFVRMGGYLTDSCEVNLVRVQHFLYSLANYEADILRRSQMEAEIFEKLMNSKSSRKMKGGKSCDGVDSVQSSSMEIQAPNGFDTVSNLTVVDKIKSRDDFKVRYYAEKFEVVTDEDRERKRSDVVLKYIEGMCWVMHYYYGGVCSWQWFYPYHYAPFASDFRGIEKFEIQFTLGEPFKPFDQLMAVFPAASGHAVPSAYRKLMTDPSSLLLPFYPQDFELDMNGKRFAWQAICKLPFIDESLLLSEIRKVEDTLTDDERQRNSLGLDKLFVHSYHPLGHEIVSFYERNVGDLELANSKIELPINPKLSDGMNGLVVLDKHVHSTTIDSPIPTLKTIEDNKTLCVFYKFPPFHAHIPRLPEGVKLPKKRVQRSHIRPTPLLWHESSAVVGRLHSTSPIPNSISGSVLSKWALQNVLAWYRELPEERKTYPNGSEAVEPVPMQCPKGSEAVGPGPKQYPKESEAVEPGPKQYPKRSRAVKQVPKQYPKESEAVEPGPKQYPKRSRAVKPEPKQCLKGSEAVEPGPKQCPKESEGVEPGSSVSKKRKLEEEVVGNGPESTQLLPLGKRVTTEPEIKKQKVEKPVSLLLRSGESVFVEQRGNGKVIVIVEPADSDTRADEPTSVAEKPGENNFSHLCNTKMVTVDLNSVSSFAPIVATSSAGVDNQPKEQQNNGSEHCDTIGVINEPVSTPLPSGNSVPEMPKIMESEVVAKDMQIDEPVSVAKSEEKNGCALVLDGDLRNNSTDMQIDEPVSVAKSEEKNGSDLVLDGDSRNKSTGVTNEPVSTSLPSGNSMSRRRRRKMKVTAVIELADSGTLVDQPTSVAKKSEEDNFSQLCDDTKTVTNNPDSISSIAPIVSTSTAGVGNQPKEQQNNGSEHCATIGVINEPVSTPLPSGNSVPEMPKIMENEVVAKDIMQIDEPVSVAKSEERNGCDLVLGGDLRNNSIGVTNEPVSTLLPSGNSMSRRQRRKKKVIAIIEPADSGTLVDQPTSVAKKSEEDNFSQLCDDTKTVTNNPDSVSSIAPIVSTSIAGVGNQPKEQQNNGSEHCDTIGAINEPVSTPLPSGYSVPEMPKIMENEVVAKDMQIDEPVSVAKSEEKNGCDLVLDGDSRNNATGVTHEPVSTSLPSGNSMSRRQRRKMKVIAIIEPADSGTLVDQPTSVAKKSEDNCSQLCDDTKTVTNNPDSVSSVAPIVSTSSATNEQNNVSQLCDTIGVTNEPVSPLLPRRKRRNKNSVVVPNGIETISSTKVDEPVSVPKSEGSLSVAQNNDTKVDEPISVAKLEDNGFSEITNEPESVSGEIPTLPVSKSKKRRRGTKKAVENETVTENEDGNRPKEQSNGTQVLETAVVANETVTVSAAENEDGNRSKEQSNGSEFLETGTIGSDSVTLTSGDITTRKRRRIRKTKQSVESGVGENPLSV